MEYVRLGTSGLQVSRIVLGCMSFGSPTWHSWVLNERASKPILKKALDLGVNFFDTSDIYSAGLSEEIIGRHVLRHVPRDKVVIATITHNHSGRRPNYLGISRKQIFDAIDLTLKRMKTDYIDIYQIPRFDWETTPEETMEALHDVVKAGKTRYIGASSMLAYQFQRHQNIADKNGWTKFTSMSNHYNLVYREEEREMIPYCRETGVGLIPWSPLARGLLAGNRKPNSGTTKRGREDQQSQNLYGKGSDFAVVAEVEKIAKKRGVKLAQVAIAWLLAKPGVTGPIIGATKAEHVTDAVGAVSIKLTAEEIAALEKPYVPHAVLGFDPTGATATMR